MRRRKSTNRDENAGMTSAETPASVPVAEPEPSKSAREASAGMANTEAPARGPGMTRASTRIRSQRDPNLSDALQRIQTLGEEWGKTASVSVQPEMSIDSLLDAADGIDLSKPENLRAVVNVVRKSFSKEVLIGFLNQVERRARARRHRQAQIRALQELHSTRRGPYGTAGPGVAAPVMARAITGAFEDFVEAIENVFESAGAFVSGVIKGLSRSVGEDQAQELGKRLLQSYVLNVVFPPVFLSGAGVGIVKDAVSAIRSAYEFAINFKEMANAALELAGSFFSSEGEDVARRMGVAIGQNYAKQVKSMLRGNIFEFTFALGRLVGPSIIYAILTVVGVPGLMVAKVAKQIFKILEPLLERFPTLRRLAERISSRRGEQESRDTDKDRKREQEPERLEPNERKKRLKELAKDPEGGGEDMHEAELMLTLEREKNEVPGPVRRPDLEEGEHGDFVDAEGQYWDIKSYRSRGALEKKLKEDARQAGQPEPQFDPDKPIPGEFDVEEVVEDIRTEFHIQGEKVIVDTTYLSETDSKALREKIREKGMEEMVYFHSLEGE